MASPQPGILASVPPLSRYLEFGVLPETNPSPVLRDLASRKIDEDVVIGLGPGLAHGLGYPIDGLRPFPSLSGPGCEVPSTQADLWVWLRGDDRGHIVHLGRLFAHALSPAFRYDRVVHSFRYERGLDLTGYEDGTENPTGDDAVEAAIVRGGPRARWLQLCRRSAVGARP